ncbi:type I restriction enzyme S subunit [Halomonas ventosae]|uniref:Type I restriction enzyme S subunit n=1 Tax=Halomonas ventosae TaxID=229007 RepID=A0A4R6ZIG0_9GAMM|nr:restriction endonuclease subunit S [Halomonas ventosae]TDR52033.1 type I restriction enzyme S subunit [Halomonas ventosae]
MSARELITDHLDLWTGAVTQKRSSGRGTNGKIELTGIKKLRELILELAVRGKLVEQDPDDEPASVLLERIADEKAWLVKEGKIKKPKKLPEIAEEEMYFELPSGWQWERLDHLFAIVTDGDHQAPPKSEAGIPFLVISNINKGYLDFSECRRVPDNYYDQLDWTKKPKKGDILYTVTGSYGIPVKVNENLGFCVQRHVAILKASPSTPTPFLKVVLSSPYAKRIADSIATGIAQKTVPLTGLRKLTFALPPVEEQHRIVDKVDELMALCDRLEQQVGDQLEAHEVLVDTLLDALTRSTDAAEVAESWARIAEHFDTLFTTEASIDKLKQAILQLAVMGQLVEQDPDDEPASELLERIAEEKARLVKQGKLKKPKAISAPQAEDIPFQVPNNWKWCRLECLALHSASGWSPQCNNTPRIGDEWGVLKVSAVSWGSFNSDENKALPASLMPRPELEVKPNDFLISRANTAELVARSAVVPEDVPKNLMMSDKIVRFVFSDRVNAFYINLFNNSKISRDYYSRVAGGTSSSMKNVSRKQVQDLLVPLPPEKEQQRIVEKVDDLMALCDHLKTRLNEAGETRTQLAEAVVEQAVS